MDASTGTGMMDFLGEVIDWFANNWDGPAGYRTRLLEHLNLSTVSVAIAALLTLPPAAWIGHRRRGELLGTSLANLGRAIPSFGIVALSLPLTIWLAKKLPFVESGLGFFPTAVAMVALAIPPIFLGVLTGVREVDHDIVEAGRAMGLSEVRLLTQVELPLASPLILSGLRVAFVQVVATATLGALVAYGGLGRFIVDGFAQRDNVELFAGAILVAALALASDWCFRELAHLLPAHRVHNARND